MLTLVGKKSTLEIIEVSGIELDIANTTLIDSYKNSLSINYGVEVTDLSLLHYTEAQTPAIRIRQGEEYTGVWVAGELTEVDFTLEDSYRILRFNVQNAQGETTDTLEADGVDSLLVSAYVFLADLSGVDTTFNGSLMIPITSPAGTQAYIKTLFTNGLASKNFKTREYGIWRIPGGFKFREENIKISKERVYDINATLSL